MKIKIVVLCAIAVFTSFSYTRAASASEPRTIIGLYDSTEEENPRDDQNFIHRNAEMVFNYLGLKVKYHDVSKGVPKDVPMDEVLGFISWFADDKLIGAREYCRWMSEIIKKGKKYIVLGNFGAYVDAETGRAVPAEELNIAFNALGLLHIGNWSDNPLFIEIAEKDPDMVEFERTLENEAGLYERIIADCEGSKVYLKLKRTDLSDSLSDAVCVTPWGGFVLESYAIFTDYITDQSQWRINPFLFFKEALSLKKAMPRYDTTTLFGRRVFYSHIDGDGVRNISRIDNKTFSGEIILNEVLKKYDLPVTASFITVDIDPEYSGSEKLVEIAREILSLDNIETGIHGFTHPLDWERQLTVSSVRGYSRPALMGSDKELVSESHYETAAIITVSREEYLDKEIKGAADYTNAFLDPRGKRVLINQWTGDCKPPAEAISLADNLGLENINGGDTRFDNAVPSYTGVAPLSRQPGGRIQVYTSNSNENIYTNSWTGPFDGFINVIETFKQTENPTIVRSPARRVAPINVYYHFYSGERKESLGALKAVYDYALTQEIIPIPTSHYAASVKGFFSGKIEELAGGGWKLTGYGPCQTVRIDDENLHPDLLKCENVVGFRRFEKRVYIHLNDADTAILYLTGKPEKNPYLIEASTIPEGLKISRNGIVFTTRGYGEGVYRFANMSPRGEYAASIYSLEEKRNLPAKKFKADSRGDLKLLLPVKGRFRVDILEE